MPFESLPCPSHLNYTKSERNTGKKCPCDLLCKIITDSFWSSSQVSRRVCDADITLPAISHPKKLLCLLEEEMPSTFHLLLIQCASLYRYLNSIHTYYMEIPRRKTSDWFQAIFNIQCWQIWKQHFLSQIWLVYIEVSWSQLKYFKWVFSQG